VGQRRGDQERTVANDDDEYRVLDVDQPSADNRIVYQKYIPVVCGLCGTRMYGTEDQVGQSITCPDCGRQCVVPPPPAPPQRRAPVVDPDEPGFDLHEEPAPAAQPTTPDVVVVQITCPHCGTSWRAAAANLADWQICNLCGSSFELPARGEDADAPEADKIRCKHAPDWRDAVGLLWPGVLTFPLHRGVRGRLVGLTVLLIITVNIFTQAIQLVLSGLGGAVPGICLYVLGVIFGGLGVCYAAAMLLAILEDTALGSDRVSNWPGMQITDWFLRCFYITNAFAISVAPGMLASLALALQGQDRLLAAAVSVFVFFPIVLLSLEENNSTIQPISIPVLKFLARGWWLWLLFYGLVIGVATGLGAVVWRLLPLDAEWKSFAAAAVGVAGIMLYFRMLGRLVREKRE
jgi:predicted RNA-binding Zn-ribbon protein involved in translation (DUF1610 family)